MKRAFWTAHDSFELEGRRFRTASIFEPDKSSTADSLVVFKPRWMVERYLALFGDLQPRHILELGIWQGGSAALFHTLAPEATIVTVDHSTDRIDALDAFIDDCGAQERLLPLYGIEQTDRQRLRQLCEAHFLPAGLDLVVDDASHYLDETRCAFNTLFPLLRDGGVYVIEDWSWAHPEMPGARDAPGFWPERPPLTTLVFEIMLACPSRPGIVADLHIDPNSALITKGHQGVFDSDFDIRDHINGRGRALLQ